jgi:hypothetical protein
MISSLLFCRTRQRETIQTAICRLSLEASNDDTKRNKQNSNEKRNKQNSLEKENNLNKS